MKIFLVCFVCVMMLGGGGSAGAEVFSPTKLEIFVDNGVNQRNFCGKDDAAMFEIPIHVVGIPATVTFCVFSEPIYSKVNNGYLGWHYVNIIDTCIYHSPFYDYDVGRNKIVWDGKDQDGNCVYCPRIDYFYIWAYDQNTPIQIVINNIEFSDNNKTRIHSLDNNGRTLTHPFLYKAEKRAFIGSNFGDSTHVELSTIQLDDGWEWQGAPQIDYQDNNYFFLSVSNAENSLASIQKFKWIPNGVAEIQRRWGEDDGYATIVNTSNVNTSCLAAEYNGNYIYSTGNYSMRSDEPVSSFYIYDIEGSLIEGIDISSWWSSTDDYEAGGQLNGGPTNVIAGNTGYRSSRYVFLNSHASCLNQMVDPLAYLDTENLDNFLVWSNGNGDYFLDKNFEETAERRWVCNDYTVGPYTNSIAADHNLFSVVGLTDAGPLAFAVLASDGTGLGYGSLPNDTYNTEYRNFMLVDYGTPYDGMYFEAIFDGEKGYYFQSQYFAKVFVAHCAVDDETTPAPFTLSQNSPNPLNPVTSIPFDLATESKITLTIYNVAGETVDVLADATLGAGSYSYDWDASKVASGVYFYKLDAGTYSRTMKMTVVK